MDIRSRRRANREETHVYRRRQQSSIDDIFDLLKVTPIWVGPLLAVGAFVLFRFVLPLLMLGKQGAFDPGALWGPLLSTLSWIAAAFVLMAWLVAELWKLFNRRLLDSQTGLNSIRALHWAEFEQLVGEAFRRQGYEVDHTGTASGDGGVDLVLRRQGEVTLVQCKQWKVYRVGVRPVRELLGVVAAQGADRGILITSGRFTVEAEQFADGNPIELIDGFVLAKLIASVQQASAVASDARTTATRRSVPVPSGSQSPACPLCGKPMVSRTARKGVNAGSRFWGCPTYPACRGTRQMA